MGEPSADEIAQRLCAKIDRNQSHGCATNIVLHDGGHLALGANRDPSVTAAGQILARYKATILIAAWLTAAKFA